MALDGVAVMLDVPLFYGTPQIFRFKQMQAQQTIGQHDRVRRRGETKRTPLRTLRAVAHPLACVG